MTVQVLLLSLLLAPPALAAPAPAPAVEVRAADDALHAPWDALLRRYVKNGVVDYDRWRSEGRGALRTYLDTLSATPSMAGWSSARQQAFWINAYNAWTVELILANPGVASIKDVVWFFQSPWKIPLAPFPGLGKGTLTLDDLEHGILRGTLPDPRLHVALVCAARSCPPLRSEAYTEARLDAQLDDQARAFLADRKKNTVDLAAGELRLSRIFEWYSADFDGAGGVPAWVARYLPPAEAEAVRSGRLRTVWLPYDWSLNGR